MSFAVVHSRALDALVAHAVTVEVHLANWLPSFTKVGYCANPSNCERSHEPSPCH
jgi:hypothetical protein